MGYPSSVAADFDTIPPKHDRRMRKVSFSIRRFIFYAIA